MVQQKLGMHHGVAFDIQAVCSGFVYAVATANSYLKNGLAKRVLVIGAETVSRILDWNDRTTCVLFGDGAGAVVMELGKDAGEERGVLATALRSDGHHWNKLYTDGGPSSTQIDGSRAHGGQGGLQARRRHDHRRGLQGARGYRPHHRRSRLVRAAPGQQAHHRRRGVRSSACPPEKVVVTVDRHANTSAASVPLALNTAVADGRIKRGDLVMIEAMGGGFTWGASLIRW